MMMAVRMGDEESIAVDGRLDEAIWKRTVPAADFIQTDPRNGAPATERTEVRIAYSRTALYMGVTCFDDEPTRLLRFQMRRDEGLPSDDRFMWVIDPFLTSQNGYFFETNLPASWATRCSRRPDRTAVGRHLMPRATRYRWTFEVEIPFSTLN
jgi:hypothetical protein